MTQDQVIKELSSMGSPSIKKVLTNHGAKEPFFGVKVGDMKVLVKKIKKDHELSLQLYDTGITDAMYLAGLIADEKEITEADLNKWVESAYWYMLSEYTVPWVAADAGLGMKLGLQWIDSSKEIHAAAGWSALSSHVSITPDDKLDISALGKLLDRIAKKIHASPNRVRHTMNGFIIAVGSYVPALTAKAKETAKGMGMIEVETGGTACKVADAIAYIEKIEKAGKLGKKKKMARC